MIHAMLSWMSQFILQIINSFGYAGIFLLSALESFNIPIPSEIVMPFAGFLSARGELGFWWVVAFGVLGNVLGSILNYFLGYFGGRSLLTKFGKYIFIHESDLVRTENWFNKFGKSAVFFSRILPIFRTFISLPAGIAKMNFLQFILYTFLGVIPWNIMLVYLGFYLGEKWSILEAWFRKFDWAILALLVVLFVRWILRHKHRKEAGG